MTHHFRKIRKAALGHHKTVVKGFHSTHKHARKLMKKHRVVIHKVRHHTVKTAAVTGISASLLATPAMMANASQAEASTGQQPATTTPVDPKFNTTGSPFENLPSHGPSLSDADQKALFQGRIQAAAPGSNKILTDTEAAEVSKVIAETFGISAKAELDGIRLNVQRGIMAGEQHLPLYPGDNIKNHFKNRITGKTADPTANLTGMVPGLPSWGYFAKDAASVTKQDVDREQWYIAAQTFLSPGWQENTNKMYNFYKYRKMIVINQETGQACVVNIADAGPSPSTGRSFGGSNEVLISLGLGKKRTGTIMTLFVDDPGDTIPLGPLTGYEF